MEPDREDPAVEQLQRAAHQMIGAARKALDALDELVSDRERLDRAVSGVSDLLERAGRAMADTGGGADRRPQDLADDDVQAEDDESDRTTATARPRRVRRIPLDE